MRRPISDLLEEAKGALYNHLQALHNLPSVEEQAAPDYTPPKGLLSIQQAELCRKCVKELWAIDQEAGAKGNAGEDVEEKSEESLTEFLEAAERIKAGGPVRQADRKAQA